MNSHLRPLPDIDFAASMVARLRRDADELSMREPLLSRMCCSVMGGGDGAAGAQALSGILARVLGRTLVNPDITGSAFEALFSYFHCAMPSLSTAAAFDMEAVLRRDPATDSALAVVLYQKGFQAIQLHRLAHGLWDEGRRDLALYLQGLGSRVLDVDIHPACEVGHGVMFDHATGIVIGETCVIGNDVSIMQGVTLGGTGKVKGDRHPRVGQGVLIGAGAVLLGNIEIGTGARVGAGSVVLIDVAANTTVVGVPAQVVGVHGATHPAEGMNQRLSNATRLSPRQA